MKYTTDWKKMYKVCLKESEMIEQELTTLKASIPKIKADAVKEIAKTNKCELNIPSYPESIVVCYFDDLMNDANKLEAGE